MADIRPFRGLRFSAEAGALNALVAPPYDVIGSEEREELASKSAHNVVHLTLPDEDSTDRSKFVKYARSAATLSQWRRDGVLKPEQAPSFYRYVQEFEVPGYLKGKARRTSLIALIKTEPYEKGVVLPHEQTFPKHKEDRLRVLEATRAHLECIFGLFEDPTGEVLKQIEESHANERVSVTDEGGVSHVLEAISDPADCARLQELMLGKKVWIADGHHRYETACTFRASFGDKEGAIAEDYMMMALASMSDPGLVLLPTHRILNASTLSAEAIVKRLQRSFELTHMEPSEIFPALRQEDGKGPGIFGLVLEPGAYLLRPKDPKQLLSLGGGKESAALRQLDVTILHRVVLENLLGIAGYESLSYTRDAEEALNAVKHGKVAAFLMNPPTVEDMRTIALGGEKMPQKSTYYFPKILSGLVLWSLNEF